MTPTPRSSYDRAGIVVRKGSGGETRSGPHDQKQIIKEKSGSHGRPSVLLGEACISSKMAKQEPNKWHSGPESRYENRTKSGGRWRKMQRQIGKSINTMHTILLIFFGKPVDPQQGLLLRTAGQQGKVGVSWAGFEPSLPYLSWVASSIIADIASDLRDFAREQMS